MHRDERRRNDRFTRSQEFDEDIARVQMAQACGLDDTAQHLLGVGAAWRAVPTRDLPIDDCRTKRLLGAPIGRVQGAVEEKAEERWEFDREMRREPMAVGEAAWRIQQVEESGDEMGHVRRPRHAQTSHQRRRGRECRAHPAARLERAAATWLADAPRRSRGTGGSDAPDRFDGQRVRSADTAPTHRAPARRRNRLRAPPPLLQSRVHAESHRRPSSRWRRPTATRVGLPLSNSFHPGSRPDCRAPAHAARRMWAPPAAPHDGSA